MITGLTKIEKIAWVLIAVAFVVLGLAWICLFAIAAASLVAQIVG